MTQQKAIAVIRQAISEAEQVEPLMITPGGGAFPFVVVGEVEQAEQEPVALHKVVAGHIKDLRACVPSLRQYPEMNSTADEVEKAADELEAALNTTTPQREWVSLTDGEIHDLLHGKNAPIGLIHGIRAIEAKLKEKNNR